MRLSKVLMVVVLLVTIGAPVSSAGDSPEALDLPPNLRVLLIREMNAILDASTTILDAIARGEDEVVAEKAQAIHDSFILKLELTPEDREVLLSSVPKEFIERDRAFHELSATLAEAAREGDRGEQSRLFGAMIQACVGCHDEHVPRLSAKAD